MANEPVAKLRQLQAEAVAVLEETEEVVQTLARRSTWQRLLHFWAMVFRHFVRNRCPLRASALAYSSLLAMVPMLAVVLSVSTSLLKNQGEEQVERFVEQFVATLTPEVALAEPLGPPAPASVLDPEEARGVLARKEVARRIYDFVGNIRSGTLGITGVIVLLFVALSMLVRIEDTFNDIWGVTRGRSWFNRVVLYWAATTLGPVLVIVTMGLTSGPHFEQVRTFISGLHWSTEGALVTAMRFLPFGLLSAGFAVFYLLMPNAKVAWQAALVGGIVGGCLWQLNNQFSVLYVSRVVTNSKIYGSLGMVPVVMIGLYLSWLILLFGAQVAYAFQNRQTYLQEKLTEGVHERSREFVALRLMTLIAQRHLAGAKPPTGLDLAQALSVPSRLVTQILSLLVHSRLVIEVAGSEIGYAPGRPLDRITAHDILLAIRAGRGTDLRTRDDEAGAYLRAEFERIGEAERQQAGAVTLREWAARLPPVP